MGTPDPAILNDADLQAASVGDPAFEDPAFEGTVFEDLLQRHLDGELNAYEERKLEEHLRSSAALEREHARLQGVVSLLKETQVPVREDFQQRVLANLPPAGWEARSARAWRLPLALMVTLGVLGAVLAKTAQPATGSIAGALSAAFAMLTTAALTGAGLLGASWKGLQIAFESLGAGSPWAMAGLVMVVLSLNVLLFLALRPRPKLAEASKDGDSADPGE